MKHFFFVVTLLFFVSNIWVACSDSGPESSSIVFDNDVDLQPVIEAKGGIFTIKFIASSDWTSNISAGTRAIDWLSVSPMQGGAGVVTLQINTQPNESYDERNAIISLTCGNVQQNITVTQKQKDALLVSSNKVEIDAIGGVFDIKLQSNVSVSYEIEESAKDWLTASSSHTMRGLTASTMSFQVAENPDECARQAVITLRGNDLSKQVTVYQKGSKPTILPSQKEYTVPSDGETIQVDLKSNTSYKVVMPDAPWITEASTRAFSAYTHYFTIAANEGYDARTAEIYFVDEENGLQEKVIVTQVQKDAIVVAEDEYTMDAAGGKLELAANANVDFKIDIDIDWIRQIVATRGLAEHILIFEVDRNNANDSRKATITLRADGFNQVIIVVQKGKFQTDGNIDEIPIQPW